MVGIIVAQGLLGALLVSLGVMSRTGLPPFTLQYEPTQLLLIQLGDATYLFLFLRALEVIVGLLLILNRFVPLALVMIAPVLAGMLVFYLGRDTLGFYSVLLLSFLEVYLLFVYRANFYSVVCLRSRPIGRVQRRLWGEDVHPVL